ncbi:MAG: TonB-dependent receptor [Bacteroidaceae bacterium]|nr:TonB-dependent receptor [Bacteroidaceae bacterium]
MTGFIAMMSIGPLRADNLEKEIDIIGTVYDVNDNSPLAGATVYIEELEKGVISDNEGVFRITDIPDGTYTLKVQFLGYRPQEETVRTDKGNRSNDIGLKPESMSLSEVIISEKSQARLLREQAMPVSVISMQQLQGTVSDIQSILARTVGVTIRASGGMGSTSRLSVRGLEGKRIGFFIDETPMADQSDFLDLNDIPIDMIDRIEIYKGVVPAKFGGSAMGGAVNIVIKEYPDHYADVSYQRESYNTNRFQTVLKKNDRKHGLVYGVGGGINYADNDYVMESPYIKGLKIKRDHDTYKKVLMGGSMKAHNWWFDEVELEPVYLRTYHEIQGIDTDIRHAHTKSDGFLLNFKLEKDDFFLEGLDFDMSTAVAYTRYHMTDTAKTYYDWTGQGYPTPSVYGGEITNNRFASDSDNRKLTLLNKLYIEYLISKSNSLIFNSVLQTVDGRPSDDLKILSLGKKVDFDSRMRSWVVGLTYDYRSLDQRFLNSLTGRYYWYGMDTRYQNVYVNVPSEPITLRKTSWGYSEAMRYRITPGLMAKLSGGYDVRIPAENELLGDGATITPARDLLPERNLSANAGLLYDLTEIHPSNLQIEVNGFYMHVDDMIRFVKGILGAQYQNFGQMRTLGIEAEVKADMLPCLYGYVNATYQDLRDTRDHEAGTEMPNPTKGKRMPNIPYLMSNAGLEFHKENLFGGTGQNTRLFADMSFIEEYFYDFELTKNEKRRIPRSLTFDLGFEHSFFDQRLYISGSIKNVADATVISEYNCPLPGRTLGLKLRYILR